MLYWYTIVPGIYMPRFLSVFDVLLLHIAIRSLKYTWYIFGSFHGSFHVYISFVFRYGKKNYGQLGYSVSIRFVFDMGKKLVRGKCIKFHLRAIKNGIR